MDKDKWMTFIHHLWATIGYSQLLKLYQQHDLPGSFFEFTYFAVRDKLLMLLAHTVHLCEEITKNFDVGSKAQVTFAEIKTLYRKGDTRARDNLNFEDAGIKTFRDFILAHPLNQIKELLGKDQYQISLKWETVEETLNKIKRFCDEVEKHYAATWEMTTYKDEVGVEIGFQSLMAGLEDGAKYDKLKLEVALKGKACVYVDWQKNEIVIDED